MTVNNKLVYKPQVFPLPNYEFDSATAMLLDQQEEPSIVQMIAKHEQRLKQQNGLQLPSEAKKQLTAGGKL